MAAKILINAEGASTSPYYLVPIEGIVVEQKNNNRYGTYTPEDLKDLLYDLAAGHGIHNPVVCRPLPDRRPLLVEGYRRYAAVKHWNNTHKPSEAIKLPVLLLDMNAEEALESNVSENVRRRSLTPMDAAIGIRNLSQSGRTDKEVAEVFDKSPAWVSQTRKLLSLEKHIQMRIHHEEIPSTVGIELSEISEEERGIVVETIDRDFNGNFTLSNLHKVCREIGAIGDGVTPRAATHKTNDSGSEDLLASTHSRGHTPKRKQRTVREMNDYLDRWDLNDNISPRGQEYIKLHQGFISGRVTDEEMDRFILGTFNRSGSSEVAQGQ